MPRNKPHILLLINDEHRPDILPIEGDTAIRTPTLTRFMDEGIYFRNAYTPSPVCVAARQSFLSGALLRLRTKAEALPSPRRKDKNNCFTDPHRPIAGLN